MMPGLTLVVLSASLGAGEGFALPACEAPSSWAPALALAGFAAGTGPVSLDGCGHPWVLTVADDAGAVHRVTVAPARTSDEREDLALLARSLRQGSKAPAIADAWVEEPLPVKAQIVRAARTPVLARSHAIVATKPEPARGPVSEVALVSVVEDPTESVGEAAPESETARADVVPDAFRTTFSRVSDADDEPLALALPVIVPSWEPSPPAPRAAPAIAAQLADAQRAAAQQKFRDDATDLSRSERFRAEKERAAELRVQHRIDRQVEAARTETEPQIRTPFDSWGSAGIGLAAASDRGASPMAEVAGGARQHDFLLGGSLTATMPTTLVGFGTGRTTNAVSGLGMVGLEPVPFGSVAVGMGAARRWFAQDGTSAGGVWIPQVGASLEARSSLHRTVDLRARIGGRYDLQRVRFESGDSSLGTMSPFELMLAVGVGG
jgi:hypothetical protein